MTGGVNTAPMPPAADPAAPVVEGDVIFGGQSRIQVEFDDDRVEVFYLLEVVNRSASPVTPKAELVLTLPADAEAPSMLEGSSTQAQVRGKTIVISGPFAPGATPVQFAFGLSGGSSMRILSQTFPAVWERPQVIVTKVGTVQMASEQFASNTEMPSDGHNFYLGSGPALPAGKPLQVTLSGLPVRSRAGRWVALLAGVLILLVGAWQAYGGQRVSAADARHAQLEARRQKLMTDLARLEEQRRASGDSDKLLARRQDLVTQLERIYGELDRHGSPAAGA